MICPHCGHKEDDRGWAVCQVDQDRMGNDIYGWFCPVCDQQVCTEGEDSPLDIEDYDAWRDEDHIKWALGKKERLNR